MTGESRRCITLSHILIHPPRLFTIFTIKFILRLVNFFPGFSFIKVTLFDIRLWTAFVFFKLLSIPKWLVFFNIVLILIGNCRVCLLRHGFGTFSSYPVSNTTSSELHKHITVNKPRKSWDELSIHEKRSLTFQHNSTASLCCHRQVSKQPISQARLFSVSKGWDHVNAMNNIKRINKFECAWRVGWKKSNLM